MIAIKKKLIGGHCLSFAAGVTNARIQSAGSEEIQAGDRALRNLQDRVGLAHSPLHFLHRHHGAFQRRLPEAGPL